MSWTLPASLNIGGADLAIRTDFRVILDILRAFNDPDLPEQAKTQVMIEILFPDWEEIPPEHMEEAARKAVEFIDCGQRDDGRKRPRMMDWEKDSDIIIPAVNKVANVGDVRAVGYMHWWTFFGYFMEIGDSLFSQVLHIRKKRIRHEKMEKWEKAFYQDNRALVDLPEPVSEEEAAKREEEKKALEEIFG